MNKFSEIADGLASWLTFEQRCGREPLFCESYLAYPVGQLLQSQFNKRVLSEVKHPVLADAKTGRGKKPRIDFAIPGNGGKNGKYELVIETKWVSESPTLLQDILKDVVRLDLLLPNYAVNALLIVAGKVKDFEKLFSDAQFQPHPNNLNSKHILPLGNHSKASVRFVPVPKLRIKLYSQVLSAFADFEISTSIPLERSGPFPQNANASQYHVYIWKIKRYDSNISDKFKPQDYYGREQVFMDDVKKEQIS